MGLVLERRSDSDERPFGLLERVPCTGGTFLFGDGLFLTVAQAIENARPSSHASLARRPYVLRITFERDL